MNDELRSDHISNPKELTTADLAEVAEQKERNINSEPRRDAPQIEHPDQVTLAGASAGVAAARAKIEEELGPLFSSDEANDLRGTWDRVQVKFVDEPRQAVEEADRLIATTMKRLAEIFAQERQRLEHQWDKGDNVSTEDLRLALRRYRSFFARLLRV